MQIGDRATAILNIGLGHYAEALTAARRAAEGNLGPFTAQALPDLVEAAARCGETRAAAEALNRLQAATAVDGSEWAAGLQVRSLALLAEGRAADRSYAEALERLGTTRLRLELARTRLLYGEWLRREGRRVDAREQLRPAHETFALVGAEAFADRARQELLATGEKVRKRQVDTAKPADRSGGAHCPARPGRPHEPRDRGRAVHQRTHSRVASAQGLHQAGRHQPEEPEGGAAGPTPVPSRRAAWLTGGPAGPSLDRRAGLRRTPG